MTHDIAFCRPVALHDRLEWISAWMMAEGCPTSFDNLHAVWWMESVLTSSRPDLAAAGTAFCLRDERVHCPELQAHLDVLAARGTIRALAGRTEQDPEWTGFMLLKDAQERAGNAAYSVWSQSMATGLICLMDASDFTGARLSAANTGRDIRLMLACDVDVQALGAEPVVSRHSASIAVTERVIRKAVDAISPSASPDQSERSRQRTDRAFLAVYVAEMKARARRDPEFGDYAYLEMAKAMVVVHKDARTISFIHKAGRCEDGKVAAAIQLDHETGRCLLGVNARAATPEIVAVIRHLQTIGIRHIKLVLSGPVAPSILDDHGKRQDDGSWLLAPMEWLRLQVHDPLV